MGVGAIYYFLVLLLVGKWIVRKQRPLLGRDKGHNDTIPLLAGSAMRGTSNSSDMKQSEPTKPAQGLNEMKKNHRSTRELKHEVGSVD